MSERNDKLNKLLDEALKAYANAPENEGLEERILVRVKESARSRNPFRLLVLAACAAVIVGAACLVWFRLSFVPSSPPVETRLIQPTPQATPTPVRQVALRRTLRPRRVQIRNAPKLAQFPAPSPMTSQERALVRLVIGKPDIPKELTDLGGPVAPIEITAIEVSPLR